MPRAHAEAKARAKAKAKQVSKHPIGEEMPTLCVMAGAEKAEASTESIKCA